MEWSEKDKYFMISLTCGILKNWNHRTDSWLGDGGQWATVSAENASSEDLTHSMVTMLNSLIVALECCWELIV